MDAVPDERWPIEDRDLTELSLDPSNVRIPDPRAGESSIAAYLVAAADVVGLATGIARDGYLDNEIPVVTYEADRLLVLEGNRRVAALKLLTGTLAPDEPDGEPFADPHVDRVLRRHPRDLETSIRVMIAPTRAAAQPLLARLHTSNPKKSWLREQQAIFYHAQLDRGRNVDDLRNIFPAADDIPRFIRMGEIRKLIRSLKFPDAELREWIMDSRLPMTSFEYAYRSPDVLAALGLSFTPDGILEQKSLTAGQTSALLYLLGRFKSGTLNTRAVEFRAEKKGAEPNQTRQEFLVRIRRIVAGEDPDTAASVALHSEEEFDIETSAGDDGYRDGGEADQAGSEDSDSAAGRADAGSSTSRTGRGPNRRDTRSRVDLGGLSWDHQSAGMRRRLEELKDLDVARFPNAAYDLLRTILECSGKVYLRTHAPQRLSKGATLRKVLIALKGEFAGDAQVLGILNQLDVAGPQTASNYAGTAQAFNAINHEPDQFSVGHEVHEAWDRIRPLVARLLT